MPSESSVKSNESPSSGDKHKNLDREIREMASSITHRVTDFHKSGSTNHLENEDEHDMMRIITLKGNNEGATLRSELDEKKGKGGDPEALNTFVNSNFQAINNSMMFGGSYHANDPGVHLDISDFTHHHQHKVENQGKKGKKKETSFQK